MTSSIKAIETVYDGHQFRSRLEARWAVFFNHLGLKYEYEKEGYDLGEDGLYLPDFWLKDLDCWIEIKGGNPSKEELRKISALSSGTKKAAILFQGLPTELTGTGYFIDIGESCGGEQWIDEIEWAMDKRGNAKLYDPQYCNGDCRLFVPDWEELIGVSCFIDKKEISECLNWLISRAAIYAKRARFEHGERP